MSAPEPTQHFMLPGTHEWPRTPECRCGAEWFSGDGACRTQLVATVCPVEDCAHPKPGGDVDCGEHEAWMT